MKKQKISKEELAAFITSEAKKVKSALQEELENAGQAHEMKMDRNMKSGDKDKALVTKTADKTEYKSGPAESSVPYVENEGDPVEREMNEQPSKEGSDKKVATAVSVKAGAEKGGKGVTTGQAKANFSSKTDNPKASVSDPFTEKSGNKMNAMDKPDNGGAKTFVKPGAEDKSRTVIAGKHKAEFSERSPKSDNDARIAQGIELKESYTRKELYEKIQMESMKLAKKIILKKEIEKLKKGI